MASTNQSSMFQGGGVALERTPGSRQSEPDTPEVCELTDSACDLFGEFDRVRASDNALLNFRHGLPVRRGNAVGLIP